MRPLLFPTDGQFWYETLRALGHTTYGGADVGEVVTHRGTHNRRRLRQLV